MSKLILKYQISEKDLYRLGVVESMKKDAGFFEKEKLKAASMKILKPYNVSFMDLGVLLGEIKKGEFDIKYSESFSKEAKSETEKTIRENSNIIKYYSEWWSERSQKQKWGIIIGVLFVLGLAGKLAEEPMDPCDCVEIATRIDLGVSYDSGEWKRCKDKYYGVSTMFNNCVTK